jgi:hypothetical protein
MEVRKRAWLQLAKMSGSPGRAAFRSIGAAIPKVCDNGGRGDSGFCLTPVEVHHTLSRPTTTDTSHQAQVWYVKLMPRAYEGKPQEVVCPEEKSLAGFSTATSSRSY